jgi:hypothetical protein
METITSKSCLSHYLDTSKSAWGMLYIYTIVIYILKIILERSSVTDSLLWRTVIDIEVQVV